MTYPLVKFGDVVRQVKDKVDPTESGLERFIAGEHMDTDNLHIRRWGDIGDGYLGPAFHMRFKRGQVLYGSRRTYLRKVAVADFEGITANTTYVIEPKDPDVLLPDFLPFVMSTEKFHEHSIKQSKGSTNPYINFSDITWYQFSLPPVDEQRKIADVLWAVEIYRLRLMELLDSTFELITSLRTKYVKPTNYNGTHIIGDVAELSIERQKVLANESYHIVGVYSFGKGLLDRGFQAGNKTKYQYLHRIHEGQIVLSKLKAWEGAIAIANSEHDFAYVSPEYPTFSLNRDLIIPEFMRLICESPWFWKNIGGLSQGTAERRARINPKEFLKVPIFVPPLQEQIQTVQQIDQLRDIVSFCNEHLENTNRLKKSLLAQFVS